MHESNKVSTFIQKYSLPVIVVFTLLVWAPVLFVQFINDDYQILGYHMGKSLRNIFQPFWQPDISGVYWRPVGNLIHPLVMYIAGFNPLPFRIVSILSYIFCCIVFYFACGRLGLSKKTSLWITLLFSVLPTHEYQVAWIADTGESLVTAFLLLTFISYENIYKTDHRPGANAGLAVIAFIVALLIKEVAFSGVLIPFFALILHGDFKKYNVKRAARDSVIGILTLAVVLIYRYFLIGGTPFGSSHFQNGGPVKWAANFFTYIMLSLFPPEVLEIILYYSDDLIIMLLIIVIALLLFYLIIKAIINMNPRLRRIMLAGAVWFVIFVLPALPTLMRWYVFTASIGIVWIIAALIEYMNTKKLRIYFSSLLLLLLLSLAIYDFTLMLRWRDVSVHFSEAYESLRDGEKYSEVTLWGVPDKVDRIPMMKLGIAETVQSAMKDTSVDVYAPLRTEITGFNSKIRSITRTASDNGVLSFELTGGRFLIERSKSKAVITSEYIDEEYEGYRFVINNSPIISTATVYCKELKGEQFFYDGTEFQAMNRIDVIWDTFPVPLPAQGE